MSGERNDRELRVSKIRNGTVIDHVPGGAALKVLAILEIDGTDGETVSIGMNVPSEKLGRKDIVKVEAHELSQNEVDVISLIAPDASINIIREFDVVEKSRVVRPDTVMGIIACPNHHCITTQDEPIDSAFDVLDDGVRCVYCDTIIREEIADHIRSE